VKLVIRQAHKTGFCFLLKLWINVIIQSLHISILGRIRVSFNYKS